MGNRLSREHRKQGIGVRKVQVAFAPSFDPGFSWDIRLLGSSWRLFRAEVIDASPEELARLVGYEEIDAPGELLREFVGRLEAVSVPIGPLPDDLGGLDGAIFQLALFGGFAEVRFQWWSVAPTQWAPLIEIADEMIKAFRRLRPKEG
jgi:hypothetical protein